MVSRRVLNKQKHPAIRLDRGVSKLGVGGRHALFPNLLTLGAPLKGGRPAPRRCLPRQAAFTVSQQDRLAGFPANNQSEAS